MEQSNESLNHKMNKTERVAINYVTDYTWKNSSGKDYFNNDIYNIFMSGHKESQKNVEKALRDIYNKYNSTLKDKETRKLTKVIDTEAIERLKIKLEVITEIKKKLL